MKKKINLVIGLIICLLLIITSISTGVSLNKFKYNPELNTPIIFDTSYHIKIDTPEAQRVASQLKMEGYDVLSGTVTTTSLELIVTHVELNNLKEQGYNPIILEKSRPFREIQAERIKNLVDVPPGYLDLSEIIDEMNDTAANYPNICEVVDLTTTYNVSTTYEGRHIYAVKISDNVSQDEDEPTFLMVSLHHCREIVTPVIALYAIEQFTSEYGTDPDITSLVDEYEIWISPVWNPDGYEYVFNVNNMWRKNRRYFSEYGTYGVDLNRNYPFGWYGACSGDTTPSSETYKGPSPASEAETQTMIAFSNDQHFTKVLDYHSSGQEVLYGYHPSCHSHPFDSFFQSEAVELSKAAGYFGSVRTPSADGENYEWQLWTNGSYANLIETHTTFQPTYSSAEAEAATVWPGTLWMLKRSISLSGHITDSISGTPLKATINITGVTFPDDEKFISESTFGRYHIFLPPDDYTVEFWAPGYVSQSHQITVTLESAEILDVPLKSINDPPEKPIISGPSSGNSGTEIEYSLVATDPDGNNLTYFIDWGDGTTSDWFGPYGSGETVNIFHTWDIGGDFEIKAKARDIYLEESSWSNILTIHIIGPIVEIEKIKSGFGVNAIISNIGEAEATNVDWNIYLEDCTIFLGNNKSGTIPILGPGESETVKSLVIGFGQPKIIVTTQYDTEHRYAMLLLFFVICF